MANRTAARGTTPEARDLGFLFLAGRPSLAFTATIGERWRRHFERLRAPADLARWFTAAGLLDKRSPTTADDLQQARALREAIYRSAKALARGREPAAQDLIVINRFALVPAPAPQLVGGRIVWSSDQPTAAALSLIARDAIDLFSGPFAQRIRECESDECALLFVDTSPPGKRRWCSSATCGSRARSASYRERHRGTN